MIWKLVKKDLTYLITSLKSTIVSIICLGLFLPMVGIGFGIAMPALVCYVGFYGILAYEERSKMHLLSATFPVTRREICLAKYMYALLIIVFAMILSLVGSLIGSVANEGSYTLLDELPLYITLMAASAIIYIAVILPFVFKFGTIKARYALMIIYIFIFVFATNFNTVDMTNVSQYIPQIGSKIMILWVVSIICWLISIAISLKIWDKKDIN